MFVLCWEKHMATNEDEVTRLFGLFASASIASPCPVRRLDGSPRWVRCCSHCLRSLSCPQHMPGVVRVEPPVCGTHRSWQSCPKAPGATQIPCTSIRAGGCCCAAAPISLLFCILVPLCALPLGPWWLCGTMGSLGCTQGGKKDPLHFSRGSSAH